MPSLQLHCSFGYVKMILDVLLISFTEFLFQCITGFFPPIAMKQILDYLENGGEGARFRPWMWIAFLFMGPTVSLLVCKKSPD